MYILDSPFINFREHVEIPERPGGQRTEAPQQSGWGFGNNPQFAFNVGFGMFPFFPVGFQFVRNIFYHNLLIRE